MAEYVQYERVPRSEGPQTCEVVQNGVVCRAPATWWRTTDTSYRLLVCSRCRRTDIEFNRRFGTPVETVAEKSAREQTQGENQ